jgi:hypothetical protein
MDTETTVLISGVVAGIVQIGKLGGIGKGGSLLFAVGVSLAVVVLYGVSHEPTFERIMLWQYFTAVVAVAGTAVGIHSAAKNTLEIVRDKANDMMDRDYQGE